MRAASLIASIIHIDPPSISKLQVVAPAALEHVIQGCMAKDPEDRWQAMRDVRRELEWIAGAGAGAPDSASSGRKSTASFRQRAAAVALIVVATGVATAAGMWSFRRPPANPVIRATIALPSGETIFNSTDQPLALSPDGTELVYNDGGELRLRRTDSFDSKVILDSDDGHYLFFSPDGEWVGFFANYQIKKVSVRGGAPIVLCASVGIPNSASWGQDGLITFAPRAGEGIWQVPASGGAPKELIPVDAQKGEAGLYWPEVLPESNAVIFSSHDQLMAQSLRTGERKVLIQGATMASFVEPGYLLYISGGNLMAAPFDAKRLQVIGPPVPIVTGVLHDESGAGMLAVSRSGSFVDAPGGLGSGDIPVRLGGPRRKGYPD
jgi:serine/threonine-protein kinase